MIPASWRTRACAVAGAPSPGGSGRTSSRVSPASSFVEPGDVPSRTGHAQLGTQLNSILRSQATSLRTELRGFRMTTWTLPIYHLGLAGWLDGLTGRPA